MEKVRFTPVLVVAAAAAFVGPLATAGGDRPAKGPFVFTPPEGFQPAGDELVKGALGTAPDGMQKVWVYTEPGAATTPNITLTHTDKSPELEEDALRALAAGMPAVFSPMGSTWTEVRHEARSRADGSRVAILDGEVTRADARKKRVLQIVFPEDKGAALVTVTVPSEDMAKWEPRIDASIASATGVATRARRPAPWLYLAWAAAGGVLGYLAMALFARRKPS